MEGYKDISLDELDGVTICGFLAVDLVMLAQLIEREGITPKQLVDGTEAYLKGYLDGQNNLLRRMKERG